MKKFKDWFSGLNTFLKILVGLGINLVWGVIGILIGIAVPGIAYLFGYIMGALITYPNLWNKEKKDVEVAP